MSINQDKERSKFLNTVFRGIIFIIPIIAFVYLFKELFKTLKSTAVEMIDNLGLDNAWQLLLSICIALILLILISYIIGLLANTPQALKASKWIDDQLISNSDTYRAFKLNFDNQAQFMLEDKHPVFVRFGEYERPGFLMQEGKEKSVVFIPSSFNNPTTFLNVRGAIYIVDESKIRKAKQDATEFNISLDHMGSDLDIS